MSKSVYITNLQDQGFFIGCNFCIELITSDKIANARQFLFKISNVLLRGAVEADSLILGKCFHHLR